MSRISFKATKDDYLLIGAIVARAIADGVIKKSQAMDINMDLSACHANGCPMNFKKLLDAPKFDFTHDVLGINRHIDRETGQLGDCFIPRCNALVPEAIAA